MTDVSITSSGINFAASRTPGWISNVGVKIDGTNLVICGSDGTALSSTNPGFVNVPSTTAGQLVTIKLDAAVQTLSMDENTYPVNAGCGITTTVAWANDAPWFIYVVNEDNTSANAGICISRNPCMTTTPAAAYIHDTDAVGASDTQLSICGFWADDAGKASKPCQCIGSIKRTWSTVTDRWTTTALVATDGIGRFQEGVEFTMPTGQNDASAGSIFKPNAGTAPVGTTNNFIKYIVKKDGCISLNMEMSGGDPNGSGAVSLLAAAPYANTATRRTYSGGGFVTISGTGNVPIQAYHVADSSTSIAFRSCLAASVAVKNQDLDDVNDALYCTYAYQAF